MKIATYVYYVMKNSRVQKKVLTPIGWLKGLSHKSEVAKRGMVEQADFGEELAALNDSGPTACNFGYTANKSSRNYFKLF
jgi:hypothetical protein